MNTTLIGYTWFVWSNLDKQYSFSHKFNSKNIHEIDNWSYDLVVCAWVRAVKWWANQNPEEDLNSILDLMEHLKTIRANKFVLISTVDVYPQPINIDEDFDFSKINKETLHVYGRNRLLLEDFITNTFNDSYIIRLPWLFWDNISKNIIFDLLNNNQTEKIVPNCKFQYYYLWNLWNDIEIALKHWIKVLNINSEPIETKEIVTKFFPWTKIWNDLENPIIYDYKTKYFQIFNWAKWYMYSKEQTINDLWIFISHYKK